MFELGNSCKMEVLNNNSHQISVFCSLQRWYEKCWYLISLLVEFLIPLFRSSKSEYEGALVNTRGHTVLHYHVTNDVNSLVIAT